MVISLQLSGIYITVLKVGAGTPPPPPLIYTFIQQEWIQLIKVTVKARKMI